MRILPIIAALLLSACGMMQTPHDRYYAMIGFVTSTGGIVEKYVDYCRVQPATASCRDKFPKINEGAAAMKQAMAQADRVFITKDSEYYDLSLSAAENAAMNLRRIIKE